METMRFKESTAARRLLVALAHPDDESFGPAGTIARYVSSGVAVHYVCGTNGEEGHAEPELLARHDSMAELRIKELACAARNLGLTAVHLLGYRDSGMENTPANQNPGSLHQAPLEEVVEKISGLIREIRPQVVLTHDATGGYFHPDHIKMHQATVEAFYGAGDPGRFPHQLAQGLAPYAPQKLYYSVFSYRWMKLVVKLLPLFGQNPAAMGHNKDVNLKRIVDGQQEITARIATGAYAEISQRAVQCYVSQIPQGGSRLSNLLRRWAFRSDTYARAIPPPVDGRVERDLFAGIDEDAPGSGR